MEITEAEPPKQVQLPFGVLDFSVKGVLNENIRYVALSGEDPDQIVVELPPITKRGIR